MNRRYPPDKRQEAVNTVIEQAEQVCREWDRRRDPGRLGALAVPWLAIGAEVDPARPVGDLRAPARAAIVSLAWRT